MWLHANLRSVAAHPLAASETVLRVLAAPSLQHHQSSASVHTDPKNRVPAGLQVPTGLTDLLHDAKFYKTASGDLIKRKWQDAYSFYEEFSHMDEVREAHDKVIYIQNELQLAQQRRSDLLHELNFVRKEIKLLDGEKSNCARSDIRYLELVRMEIDANQREAEKLDAYQQEDQRERDLFTHLTAAVKASHEKEKIYANTVKYWSIIGSILGAALGVAGSALSYHYRQNSYRTLTDNYTEQVVQIESHIDRLHGDLEALRYEMQAARLQHQRTLEVAVRQGRVTATAAAAGQSTESWWGFGYRKTAECYRWFVPKQKEQTKTTTAAAALLK